MISKVGSMTFSWAMSSHLDEADGQTWWIGPKNRTSSQIFMSPDSLRVMVTRHPFERLVSLYNFMQQELPVDTKVKGSLVFDNKNYLKK